MVEYMEKKGTCLAFTVRKCWKSDADHKLSELRITRQNTNISRSSTTETDALNEPMRLVWCEERAKQFHNRSEIELLQLLPKNLARELLMEARSPVLMKQLLFIALTRFCPRFFERLCCDLLQASCVMPNESIYTQGVVAKCMFVVAAGDMSLFTYGFVWQVLSSGALRGSQNQNTGVIFDRQKEMKSQILNEGTVVCEPTLWVRWVHCGDFDSISQVSLLSVEITAFEDLVKSYVSVQDAMHHHAARVAQALNCIDKLSDLFSSVTALQVEDSYPRVWAAGRQSGGADGNNWNSIGVETPIGSGVKPGP